ncbi:MAG TPA: Rab family GTPase [Vicinamibacterales bacterium]|jgi:hypothetical protein
MIQKKVCLIGAFAVGKTSLVARYVRSVFSDKYLTTVGVKIERKSVSVADLEVRLILWDLHGEDEFQKVRTSYMRGSSGIILVADGTRRETLDKAILLHGEVRAAVGEVPCVLALNKCDLVHEWELDEAAAARVQAQGWTVVNTSAKTGTGVEEMFAVMVRRMLGA